MPESLLVKMASGVKSCPKPCRIWVNSKPLQWRYNEHDGVSKQQRPDCLLNRLFRHASKRTPKLRWPLWGKPPATGGFPSQRVSDAEKVSIWLRHHATDIFPNFLLPSCASRFLLLAHAFHAVILGNQRRVFESLTQCIVAPRGVIELIQHWIR